MIVSAAVAHGKNREIGERNRLPWKLSGDLKNFKKHTMGKAIVMGRKTFESIGRPLPGRENIVLSRDPRWSGEGVTKASSVEELFLYAQEKGIPELVVIGGQKVFEQTMERLDIMYLTEVEGEFPAADAFFPDYDPAQWDLEDSFRHPRDEKNEYPWTFKILRRKRL